MQTKITLKGTLVMIDYCSQTKTQQMEQRAEDEMRKLDEEMTGLIDEKRSINELIKQTYEDDGLDYESLGYEQRVELIRQVIERIIVRKPSKRKAEIEVVPKFGKTRYFLNVNVYTNDCEMTISLLN